jgi:hypothetical protein
MSDLSPTTGLEYYSGSWINVQDLCRSLNIGEGKLAAGSGLNQATLNRFQERVDREIDGLLGDLYFVPIVPLNQKQPDGTTKLIYPGNLRRAALYWTCGLLMQSQFSGVSENANEVVVGMIEDARKEVFKMKRMNSRLPGQRLKAGHLGHTFPPTMMPPVIVEQDW